MARRARESFGVFREAVRELAEFEFSALVKLGYRVDGAERGRAASSSPGGRRGAGRGSGAS